MAEIIYNNVRMKMARVQSLQQRAVYDRAGNYQYTHFLLDIAAVFNPKTMVDGRDDDFGVNLWGPDLVASLRHRLLQPRKTLLLEMGERMVLESPQISSSNGLRLAADANFGPRPIACNVQQFHGSKSAVVHWIVETWLNECPGKVKEPPPTILTHTWEMTESFDERYLSTRSINGEATFRADLLLDNNEVPDDWRTRLVHQCPAGFQRQSLSVTPTADGTGIRYAIVDVQQIMPLKKGTIIRVSGYKREGWNWHVALNPAISHDAHIDVWGKPTCTSAEMVEALLSIYASAVAPGGWGNVIPGLPAGATPTLWHRGSLTVHFPERRASLDYGGILTPGTKDAGGQVVLRAATFAGMWQRGNFNAVNWPETIGVYQVAAKGDPCPVLGGDNNDRGNILLRLVAQVINADGCKAPLDPPSVKGENKWHNAGGGDFGPVLEPARELVQQNAGGGAIVPDKK